MPRRINVELKPLEERKAREKQRRRTSSEVEI